MSNITTLGIDLAKNVFQIHGADKEGNCLLKKRVRRAELLEFIAKMKSCNIYMEACGSSNYWGREFRKLGHKVKLIHAKYVKPYVERNKNDAADAEAIVEASRSKKLKNFVEVRTIEQQDVQSIHRMRSRLIQARTALVNQTRGLLAEYGIIIPQGIDQVRRKLPEIMEDGALHELSDFMRANLRELYEELVTLDNRIENYAKKIESLFENNETCKRLKTIPGVGVLIATILASTLGTGAGFKNGRHFAAFLGITPRQESSGEKERLLGISKKGDSYTRSLLVHGARAVIVSCARKNKDGKQKTDKQSCWVRSLVRRKGWNKTAVALANKIARTAWAVVSSGSSYNPNYQPDFSMLVKGKSNALVMAH
jgi:transposase